ncbi:MAG: hypothetical protein AABW46_03415 [Nanoarchaeota archaeon]
MNKKLLVLFLLLGILIVLLIKFALAQGVTGAIGNPITVIHRQNVTEGEEVVIDRELIVINKNDFPVDVTLEPSVEIEDIIELLDEEFTIEANQEKRARFKIILEDNFIHSGKIIVNFKSPEGDRIGLASKITILGDDVDGEDPDEENEIDEGEDPEEGVSFGGNGSAPRTPDNNSDGNGLGITILILISVLIIGCIVGFVILIRR